MTGFPELISSKTADIPFLGRDDEAWGDSELNKEAGGSGGGMGRLGAGAFGGADTATFPVALHAGPNG